VSQLAFYFDASACIGCKACDVACKEKNNLPSGIAWRQVFDYGGGDWSDEEGQYVPRDLFSYHVSTTCMHCADPPCVNVCLSNSLSKREDGVVINDLSACEGCRSCESVCPYGALHFDTRKGVMTKCDFCADLLETGEMPACTAICPQRCLDYGELADLRARYGELDNIAPLPDASHLGPAVVFVPHEHTERQGNGGGKVLNRFERSDSNPLPIIAGKLVRFPAHPEETRDWGAILPGQTLVVRLLARAIGSFPDRPWLDALIAHNVFKEIPFARAQPDVIEGLQILDAWAKKNAGALTDFEFEALQVDHTHLFTTTLGGAYAPPWESVYCNDSHLLYQQETLAVRNWYRRLGLEPQRLHQEPDDHIALELGFIAFLAAAAGEALESDDTARFTACIDAQCEFASEHLLRWAPHWCRRVAASARTDFFRGVALLTRGSLTELAALLNLSLPKAPPTHLPTDHHASTITFT